MVQSDRWLMMAGAMDQALDRMRTAWLTIEGLRELHSAKDCFACHPGNWRPLLDEIEACAEILKHGLKARGRQS